MTTFKNIILGVGIVIGFGLVLWQGIEAFYPSPQYENFCAQQTPKPAIETQGQCTAQNGTWFPQNVQCITAPCPQGYCDFSEVFTECQKEWDEAQDKHAKIVFFIALIVGIIVIIIGYTILKIEPVGSSLIGSGIWAIFWGTVINWRNFANVGRFILLLIVLILLIWLAIKLNLTPKKK